MADLVIIGAGGFAREASLLVEQINNAGIQKWNLLGFIDDDQAKWGTKFRGYEVLGGWKALQTLTDEVSVICVVGEPVVKKRLADRARELKCNFATLIHPQVAVARDVVIGKGVLINQGCLLTTNIKIGDHVSINPGCGIGHDSTIDDYTTLMWQVNISGTVRIGEGCLIGTGATVLQQRSVGSWCTIGAGAVVTRDLPDNLTVVGVPAKPLSQKP